MAQGPGLRVVSYNVHGLHDDLAALAAVVRGLRPDIVVVQEAPRRLRWRTRCATLAHSFGLFVGGGGMPALGNLILVDMRVRVRETWNIRFPLTPGRHMRGGAFVRCTVGTSTFVVAGSHLSVDDAERPAQAALLKQALHEVDVPLVLAADINETDTGPSWRALAEGMVDAALAAGIARGMVDAALAAGTAAPPTFPAATPDRRIDVIFVAPEVTVAGCEVPDAPEVLRASDHRPVVADLVLPA